MSSTVSAERFPVVSVDNMVGQYYDSIDFDFPAIQDFYNKLPFKDKKPLEDCHIHVSGLAYQTSAGVLGGAVYLDHELNTTHDPQSPPDTDIVIMLGSCGASTTEPSEVLGHELVHFAADQAGAEISEEEAALLAVQSLLTSRKFKVSRFLMGNSLAAAFLYGVDTVIGNPNVETVALQLFIANVGFRLLNRAAKKKSITRTLLDHTNQRLYENYKEDPREHRARHVGEDISSSAITVSPKDKMPHKLVRSWKSKNRMVDFVHRKASLRQLKLS